MASFRRMSDLDLAGKRVFIRADLNVPQDDNGTITDDTRIRASVPGIRAALSARARVMVTSHLGRPTEGEASAADSLAPIAKRLSELLDAQFSVLGNWTAVGDEAIKLDAEAPSVPGVYAFVVDDEVVYVGLTNNGLRARFEQYRIGHEKQLTNARIKKRVSDIDQ